MSPTRRDLIKHAGAVAALLAAPKALAPVAAAPPSSATASSSQSFETHMIAISINVDGSEYRLFQFAEFSDPTPFFKTVDGERPMSADGQGCLAMLMSGMAGLIRLELGDQAA